MNHVAKVFGSVSFVAALGAHAAGTAAVQYDLSKVAQQRAQAQAGVAAARTAGVSSKTSVSAATIVANPYRAYPPSCLGSPLPLGLWAYDPNYVQKQVTLYGDPLGDPTEQAFHEVDTVSVFRVPCTSGHAALLMEIDRPNGHDTAHYPIFPGVTAQNAGSFSGPPPFTPRLAEDANTVFSNVAAFSPLTSSSVYVFENFFAAAPLNNYETPLVVTVDNLNQNDPNRTTNFSLPGYIPPGSALLPITGYLTGNWADSSHGGEGIQTEVDEVDNSDGTVTNVITVAWYTFDSSGTPYWLFGSGVFQPGDTSASFQLGYSSGGGFAGAFTPPVNTQAWGTITVTFPDCDTMKFTYASAPGLPNGVPSGTGTRTWTRTLLLNVNGLTCK